MYFSAEDVKLTHPARPLDTAQLVAKWLKDGRTYEAALVLGFGAGSAIRRQGGTASFRAAVLHQR